MTYSAQGRFEEPGKYRLEVRLHHVQDIGDFVNAIDRRDLVCTLQVG
eukprot:CAMPEP_0119154704 /NCGR_PEP_ID=MMETSP1310-20130426/51164_1 /TAXON_ID=464262 /ORGANISM="Genus nov. species nov., Strain RCC2339" /LENGTH=46 /DNA_ID= /DNA_START= /DNA_END= /DNA_ORIENTATION=